MAITKSQEKALNILKETSYLNGLSASQFAQHMWKDSNMHTTSKNTGNGACRGKAAWLCGGSYLAKLRKKGWVAVCGDNLNIFYITTKGKEALEKKL